jgi:hypothetical protein
MANEQDRNQSSTESDISKSQSQQQPQGQSNQQRETGEPGQFETGQQNQAELDQQRSGSPDEGLQGDTLAQQRTDIEGAAGQEPEAGEAESGFVGSQGKKDTSSELVDEQDFDKDGQGAVEDE